MLTITEQAISLSVAEKLELISTLWDDVAQNPMLIPVPEWQRAELEKRIESQRTNPEVGQSWDEVKQEILYGEK